jgi:hypothetical protein
MMRQCHSNALDDDAGEENRSFAEADLQLARGQLAEAQAGYGKVFHSSGGLASSLPQRRIAPQL